MQYCENCMAMKQSVALVDNNNIKKTRKNMDNNTNRINSLNANRLNSQTSNERTQSRTSTSRVFVRGTGLRSLAGCGIPKEEVLEMTEMMYGGFQSSRATASCMKQAPKAEFTHFIEKIASDQ